MRVLDGIEACDAAPALPDGSGLEASVVCVGVFDGVHLGHQRLLHELLELSSALRGVPTVVTFREHPERLLRGTAPPLIVSLPHRLRLLRRAGVERVLLLDFDERVREMTPEEFAERVLVRGLRARGLLLGYDSALGKDREGTPARFREIGARLGFVVREAAPFAVDGEAVSSTRIREAIARGDLPAAHRLLGRWPGAFGRVVHGDGRGRGLGYATANVVPESAVLPPRGVYAATVMRGGEEFPAVVNLGVRPTFGAGAAGDDAPVLEVHLLDFDGDLYGETLEVAFQARLRGERRFGDADELRAQIRKDVARARELLAT